MIVRRPARAALRPYVELFWASDECPGAGAPRHEAILPTGAAHIVVRLSNEPLRIFESEGDPEGYALRGAMVGGVRTRPYRKTLSCPAATVGVQFRPGAAAAMLGTPARFFAEAHRPLEDFWGTAASLEVCERIAEARGPRGRIDTLEALLAVRLPCIRGIHPAIANVLTQLHASDDVGRAAARSGYSHRQFDRLFGETVGLRPKLYCRVRRFARVLEHLAAEPAAPWADVAAAAGYADQPHFNREFRAFAGLTPGSYRAVAAGSGRHVPL